MCMYTGGHTCVCGSPCSCKYPHVSEVIPINPWAHQARLGWYCYFGLSSILFFFFFRFILCVQVSYLHICMYIVCVPVDGETPCGARNQTKVLCKNSKCFKFLSYLSSTLSFIWWDICPCVPGNSVKQQNHKTLRDFGGLVVWVLGCFETGSHYVTLPGLHLVM